jgi:hypothetical protein
VLVGPVLTFHFILDKCVLSAHYSQESSRKTWHHPPGPAGKLQARGFLPQEAGALTSEVMSGEAGGQSSHQHPEGHKGPCLRGGGLAADARGLCGSSQGHTLLQNCKKMTLPLLRVA